MFGKLIICGDRREVNELEAEPEAERVPWALLETIAAKERRGEGACSDYGESHRGTRTEGDLSCGRQVLHTPCEVGFICIAYQNSAR